MRRDVEQAHRRCAAVSASRPSAQSRGPQDLVSPLRANACILFDRSHRFNSIT